MSEIEDGLEKFNSAWKLINTPIRWIRSWDIASAKSAHNENYKGQTNENSNEAK